MVEGVLLWISNFKFIRGTAHRLAIWRSGDQSVIKSCVRGDDNSFSSVLHFSSQAISCNCSPYCTVIWYSRCGFGCDRSVMQDTLPENQSISWWCLGYCWSNFPKNSHLSLYVNLPKTMCCLLPIIKIKFCRFKSCATGRLYLMPL